MSEKDHIAAMAKLKAEQKRKDYLEKEEIKRKNFEAKLNHKHQLMLETLKVKAEMKAEKEQAKKSPDQAPQFVRDFLEQEELVYDLKYDSFIPSSPIKFKDWPYVKRNSLVDYISTCALETGFPMGIKQIVKDTISILAKSAIKQREQAIIDDLTVRVSAYHQEQGLALLKRLLYIATGHINELDLVIMRQFLWSVKRRLCGKAVKYVLMPIFYGGQGTGKSSIIWDLTAPLGPFRTKASCDVFSKNENLQLLERMRVLFIDEMEGATKTNVESYKKILSNGDQAQRSFHTQDVFNSITPVTTFIGASNVPLREIIKDSEMRRFWEIKMADFSWVSKFWESEIETMDWRAIWDAVDVSEPEPLSRHFVDIRCSQIMFSNQNIIAMFLQDRCKVSDSNPIPVADVYSAYISWSLNKHIKTPYNKGDFVKNLQAEVPIVQVNGKLMCGLELLVELDFDIDNWDLNWETGSNTSTGDLSLDEDNNDTF